METLDAWSCTEKIPTWIVEVKAIKQSSQLDHHGTKNMFLMEKLII